MLKMPKNETLPSVTGVQTDFDDRDNPTMRLVGLVTEEGISPSRSTMPGPELMATPATFKHHAVVMKQDAARWTIPLCDLGKPFQPFREGPVRHFKT